MTASEAIRLHGSNNAIAFRAIEAWKRRKLFQDKEKKMGMPTIFAEDEAINKAIESLAVKYGINIHGQYSLVKKAMRTLQNYDRTADMFDVVTSICKNEFFDVCECSIYAIALTLISRGYEA